MSDHVLDRLSAFLDEELPAREQAAVEGHLRDCSACSAYLDLLRSVDVEARALPLAVPDGYFDTLPGRIRGRLEKTPRPVVRRVPVWTWAVAAALLLGVVTPLTMQRDRFAAPEPTAAPMPPPTYPASAAAEPAPLAGVVAGSAPGSPSDKGALEGKAKKDGAPARLRRELADADRDLGAASAAPALSARDEAQLKEETDKLQYAHEALPESVAPSVAQRSLPAGPGGPYSQQQAPVPSPATSTYAEAPSGAPAPAAPPAGERRADANEASSEAELAKREDPASRPQAGGAAAAGRVSSAVASSDEKVFRLLQGATVPQTLSSLRERRESWRAFARDFPSSPRVDEARVRVIETGAEAWRVGGELADLTRAREDAAGYLARRDAAQASRVRALLETLPARP